MLVCVFSTHFAHGTAGAARIRHSLLPLSRDDDTQTSGASRRENADGYLLFDIRIESQRRDVQEPGNAGHNAFTIASSPSVSAAGPGCRISGDLISTMRSLRTAGISFQPGRFLILSGTTFLPHQEARITSGAAARITSGEMIRSFAAC